MPRDKDLKRIVRTRMEKTGEAYTTARAHVITSPDTLEVDYASITGSSDRIVREKTGRDWSEWVRSLDELDAASLEHGAIARIVHERFGVGSWWAQTVTVGYERIRGLREAGQRRSGTYEFSRSRTVGVSVERLFDACADDVLRHRWLADPVTGVQSVVNSAAAPVVTRATRPRTMRLRWPDGSRVAFHFTARGEAKSTLTVQHVKLPDRAIADRLKAFWSERLGALKDMLSTRT